MYAYVITYTYIFLHRITSIEFSFSLATQYQKFVVEDYNPIDAKFFIAVSLDNEIHGSGMNVEATLYREPELKRLCRSFRKRSTIVDSFVMMLLILSSWTYIMSIVKTIRLAKVIMIHGPTYTLVCVHNLVM